MEELLREILAELKKLNSGNKVTLLDSTLRIITKISGTDLLVMLDREKSQESSRVRTENKEEKPEVKEYTLQEIVEKISFLLQPKMSSGSYVVLGNAIVQRQEIKAIEDIRRCDTDFVRATIYLDNGSNLTTKINLDSLMGGSQELF